MKTHLDPDGEDDLHRAQLAPRLPPREALPQHHAKGKDVDAVGHGAALKLQGGDRG